MAALSESPVEVAEQAGLFEALGALRFAAQSDGEPGAAGAAPGSVRFPADPRELVRPIRSRIGRLEPARRGQGSVLRLAGEGAAASDPAAPAALGLDLGSTGSKAALIDACSGAVLASVYRRTEGNPVEAAQALVAEVGEMAPNPVVAVGLTGSGRDAAATVFRAAFPVSGSASRYRTRSSRTRRRPPGWTRTAAAASPSSRSAARTPSSSTSRTAAWSTRT